VTTGERLRKAIGRRFGKKLSQAKVAEALDVPPGNLSEWLSGKHEPNLSSLRHMASGLTCSVASLIGDEGPA
jgi:transcriptional regulator with XRE-family HTH domain